MIPFVSGYGFLFAFHSNYGRTFSRFSTIHERDRNPARRCTIARAALRGRRQSRGKNDGSLPEEKRLMTLDKLWVSYMQWRLFIPFPQNQSFGNILKLTFSVQHLMFVNFYSLIVLSVDSVMHLCPFCDRRIINVRWWWWWWWWLWN